MRDATKYHRMAAFARALPAIRRRVDRDLREPPLSRPYVLATVVRLLERTRMRIGNEEYATKARVSLSGIVSPFDRTVPVNDSYAC